MPRPALMSAVVCLLAAILPSCGQGVGREDPQEISPPVAEVIPKTVKKHGLVRIDNYYWLRERTNPKVLAYLEAENAYTEAMMAGTRELQERLVDEITRHVSETDLSVPVKRGDYFYYTRWDEGKEYPIYARKKGSLDAPEEIMLDVNELAEGHESISVPMPSVSSGQDIIAFRTVVPGRPPRLDTIRFKDLSSGQLLEDEIPGPTWRRMAWANDNRTLFYVRLHPETFRWYQVYRHVLGTDPADDELVYEELDEEYRCWVHKTKSDRYVVITSMRTITPYEHQYLDAEQPSSDFKLFLPRTQSHEHSIEHMGDYFYIHTNDGAENFRIMRTPVDSTDRRYWQEVVPGRDDTSILRFQLFREHLVLEERRNGLRQIRIHPLSGEDEHYLHFGEQAYMTFIGTNYEVDTNILRYVYTSLTTPRSVYEYNMETRKKVLLKRQDVLGGFDPEDYFSERRHAPARDGTMIPISLVYRRGTERKGNTPLLLVAYGAYGISTDPTFSGSRLSLLDRGFIYAIAHVRGGGELGRQWHDDGRLLNKENTFTDFIDVAEYLTSEGYTSPEGLFARGESAGGLLIGAVINLRPDLFKGVIAHVPWVDMLTSMLDGPTETDEWGDPNEEQYYRYMLSYSPYENVEPQDYPSMLVTTGLHDKMVGVWGPAKWVAKLRAMKTDNNVLILRTNMETGHAGSSGRYQRLRDLAFEYAFLLRLAGLDQ